MHRWRLSPRRYEAVCVAALALVSVIVVSGAAVRLTGSGLGCDDWPRCNAQQLVDVSSGHAAIEQINRLFTGLVSVGVIVAVLGSRVRTPRRRDLTWWSAGLVLGLVGQIVLGGITVLVHLNPVAVQGHFLLSMVLVANGVVLLHLARRPDEAPVATPVRAPRLLDPVTRRLVGVVTAGTLVAITLGTIVTGAGPHAGDERARRFDLAIGTAARIHSAGVWLAVASVVALGWRLRSSARERHALEGPLTLWACLAVAQIAVGYVQYFSGVPAVLVAVHVGLATGLWIATVRLALVARSTVAGTGTGMRTPAGAGSGEAAHERDGLVDHV
jgi:cytochrome c oxidase assembly protein subunit 15